MANNWQPPFGMPFPPFPPPQPPLQQYPHASADNQNAPSDAYQPPPAAAAAVPPPTWNIPGLNFQSHNQNAQQPPFPAAWPPNAPTPEQLAQWSQMQMDMQQLPFMMMQNMPPIPGVALASNQPPHPPFHGSTPAHPFPALPPNLFPAPAQADHVPQAVINNRITDVTESDKEEGEVSEGSHSPAVNDRTPQDPPRSVPLHPTRLPNKQDVYDPDKPSAGQASDAAPRSKTAAPVTADPDNIARQRIEAKAFIKLLHENNIGYHALAVEGLDTNHLRDLYRSLNLPSEPEPVPVSSKVNGTSSTMPSAEGSLASRPTSLNIGSQSVTAVNTSVPPTKSAPSPANRKEYLAQLQAAKKARQQGGAKATPPPALTPSRASSGEQGAGASENGQLTEAEKKAKTTELIRRRLENLKKNSSLPTPSSPSVIDSSVSDPSTPLPKAINALPRAPHNHMAAQSIPPSPFGNIPGLFMNPSPVANHSQSPVTPVSVKRKLSPPSSVNTTSLRAGQNGQAGHGAELDGRGDVIATPSAKMIPIQNGGQAARALPVASGLPPRPPSVAASPSGISTPGPQTPYGATRSKEMDEKARKQAALKERLQKKIEEQKRQAEQNRLASLRNSPKPLPQQVGPEAEPGHRQDIAREPKRRRKADIEAEKSALDVDIAENAARLAQITKELELLTANDKKMRQDKERLQAELESLGIDTEGMPHAELQAKKVEIERKQGASLKALTATAAQSVVSPTVQQPVAAPVPVDTTSSSRSVAPSSTQLPESYTSVPPIGSIPGLNATFPSASTAVDNRSTPNQQTGTPHIIGNSVKGPELVAPAMHPAVSTARGIASNNSSKPATPIDDEEDFYSPDPTDAITISSRKNPVSSPTAAVRSSSGEGEMIMSDLAEDDYEPEDAVQPLTQGQVLPRQALGQDNSAQVLSSGSSMVTDEDEEPYEPPDADQSMSDLDPHGPDPESGISDQQGEGEGEEMDMSTSSDEDSDSDASSDESDELPSRGSIPVPSNTNSGVSVTAADNPAPELQPETSAVASAPQDLADPSATSDVEKDGIDVRSFVPYESPLRAFKSYRYHPNFAQDVSSGFLSMTYSHQIDPDKPLCENEALGYTCTDASCRDQHFGDMNISGDKLLVQLGTANPGKTVEEKQRWNDGLRAVLKDLRQKNSKDPTGIAVEIANFRRQFLQDSTRVVNL